MIMFGFKTVHQVSNDQLRVGHGIQVLRVSDLFQRKPLISFVVGCGVGNLHRQDMSSQRTLCASLFESNPEHEVLIDTA